MSFTLITGPARSGKTTAALETIVKYPPLEAAGGVRYVVPTLEAVRQTEERLIERTGRSGIIGNVVCSFYSFAAEFVARKGLAGRLISDIQKELTLKTLADSADLDFLKESALSPGFISALDRIIGEMKISLVTPEDLERALAAEQARLGPEASRKIAELAALYRRYQEQVILTHDLHDREGLMWRALEIAEAADPGLSCVVFDGFDQLNNVERQFFSVIRRRVPEVVATVCYELGRDEVFAAVQPTRRFYLDLGAVEKRLEQPAGRGAALDFLERTIFTDAKPALVDDSVIVIEGCDRAMEVEMAALEIKRLVVDGGLDMADIVLAAREPHFYRQPVERIFADHEIPVREGLRPLAETAPARLAVCSMRIVSRGWPREEVTRLLKSEMVADSLTLACQVEMRAKRLGLVGGREKWLAAWGDPDPTHKFRLAVLKPAAVFEDSLRRARSLKDRAEAARELLARFKWRFEDDRCLAQDAAAAKKLNSILDELEASTQLIGENDAAGFMDLFQQAINQADYLPAETIDSVALVPVDALVGAAHKVVFLLGLLEKVFPRQAREEAFLRDFERAILNRRLNHPLPLKLDLADRERFLFYSVIGAAQERLYLCYPLTDAVDNDSLPSFYLDQVDQALGGPARRRRDHTQLAAPLDEAAGRSAMMRSISYYLTRDPRAAAGAYNALAREDRAAFAGVFSDNRDRPAVISDAGVRERLAAVQVFRCTELEVYAACPFQHFCRYVLGLEPVAEAVGALDIGSLLHELLFRLFTDLRDELGKEWAVDKLDPAATVERALSILAKEFDNNPRLANLSDHEATAWKSQLQIWLKRYLTGEITKGWPGFTPTYFELEFGGPGREDRPRDPRSTTEPLVLEAEPGRTTALCGKIDRVDLNSAGALVIDYKTGKSPGITGAASGTAFQPILYALALKHLFGIDPVGAEYRPIKTWEPDGYYKPDAGAEKRNRVLDEEEFAALLADCATLAVDLSERLRAARIEIDPVKCSDYCAFSHICRIDRHKLLALAVEAEEAGRRNEFL